MHVIIHAKNVVGTLECTKVTLVIVHVIVHVEYLHQGARHIWTYFGPGGTCSYDAAILQTPMTIGTTSKPKCHTVPEYYIYFTAFIFDEAEVIQTDVGEGTGDVVTPDEDLNGLSRRYVHDGVYPFRRHSAVASVGRPN